MTGDPNPPAPQWLTDVIGPTTPDEYAEIRTLVDTFTPMTHDERNRLRLIFRTATQAAS